MSALTKKVLYWSPRVLGIAFALFLSLFALDVLGEGGGFLNTLVGLLIHLVPTALVVLVLMLAWQKEWIGAALFFGLAIYYGIMTGFNEHWSAYLLISGPMVIIGTLFLVGWLKRDEVRVEEG